MLVAGGAGFVGSTLARVLTDLGARVVSFDDYSTGSRANLPQHPRVEAVEGDASDAFQLIEVMRVREIELVFNCIGDTFVPEAYQFPQRFFERNVLATLNVLRAAKESGVKRVLHVSSTEVYGETGAEPTDESCALQPLNTYAVSKLAADRLCYTYHLEHALPVIVARIFNCYGPRATHPYVIPEIIRQLHEGPRLRLGNLEVERDFTHVEDTARALVAVMASDLPDGDAVNVGTGQAHSVASLVKRLAVIMGVTNVQVDVDAARLRRHDIRRFCADNGKLRRATGWEPRVSIDEGLRQTVAWFRENGCRWSWMRPH
ncbi:NAD-dependent epimerase/dehydratase family protein [Corallococcus caeni]|uniref:NAD-dependent epimerase/dehydratase family protein n=1 Tax=Corallococcus caeni TaxID=3082388 RepID=UPI0030C69042